MMTEQDLQTTRSTRYWALAQGARMMAQEVEAAERPHLLYIAAAYERLAERAEQQELPDKEPAT